MFAEWAERADEALRLARRAVALLEELVALARSGGGERAAEPLRAPLEGLPPIRARQL